MSVLKAVSYFEFCHKNSDVVNEIKKINDEGVKVNLFIGRRPVESDMPLPESARGTVWVSLDKYPADPTFSIDPRRLHLVVDCNDSDQMRKINGLFQTVVVDLSTTKFFEHSTLQSLMSLVAPNGELIIPSEFQFVSLGNEDKFDYFNLTISIQKDENYDSDYKNRLSEFTENFCRRLGDLEVQEDLIETYTDLICNCDEYRAWLAIDPFLDDLTPQEQAQEFLSWYAWTEGIRAPEYAQEKETVRERTVNALLEHFTDVQIHRNKPYPYANNAEQEGDAGTYFHASNRKESIV